MPARVSTTRRGALTGALGGALGLVALAACDVDDLRPPEDQADPVPSPTPGATETPEPDADATLVDDVVAAIQAAAATVVVARELPRLRPLLGPLARAHAAHLDVLEGEPTAAGPTAVPASRPEELARVRQSEQQLQQTLVDGAVAAQSGALARLLASMSASVSQHLAALDGAG